MKHAWILVLALAGCAKPCNPSGKPVQVINTSVVPTMGRDSFYYQNWLVHLQDKRYCQGLVNKNIILAPGESYKLENFTEIPT
jgi:ABC-type uncharacterized transport system auxiliary subunit